MAVSSGFEDKKAAVAGIEAVRECAGTGLITDLSCQAHGRAWERDRPATRLPGTMDRPRILDLLAS